ncbi:SprT family protein [Ferroacidibacillus organovorans]|uniref:SprT family protein n=1 Tax=Ferroacidibacillus organovorans TaxID=1765683 RepID=A0A161QF19_9BACL|nr:SprT family protein [Ferroacidibacillus organovorans]KYP80470.1 SprT family protein [Ferroacidibacillus organovorans]OAG94699.1 SprT family protein [Ferroacidibacillus organovorans]OPG16585.1 SprT family protein [Ferroacidibacillus organovorans]
MEGLPRTDAELKSMVCMISMRDFHLPFSHDCRFNARLRSTGGRYILSTHNVEINPSYAHRFGIEELIRVIRHELVHYHLHLAGRGYRHQDRDFKELLSRVDGARYARAHRVTPLTTRYAYRCTACGANYVRKRKLDTSRYACGSCRGKLEMIAIKNT